MCPECGWTGQESDLDESGNERLCPTCEYVMEQG